MKQFDVSSESRTAAPLALNRWSQQVGVTSITAWRWRKRGWLTGIVNIAGRPYITPAGIAEFNRRAEAGEFAKEHKVPRNHANN